MAVKIRLQRHGAKRRPFYFIVAAHNTVTRDGNFIEKLGTYNPLTVPATIVLNRERSLYWLNEGAIPSDTVDRILSFKGVKFMKHLQRGVKLGLFDEATAKAKFETWDATHETEVSARREGHKKAKADAKHALEQVMVKKVEEKNAAKAAVVAEAEATAAAEAEAAATPEVEAVAEVTEVAAEEVVAETAAPEAEATPEAEA
jgi:small subunit ribosomal protein S16